MPAAAAAGCSRIRSGLHTAADPPACKRCMELLYGFLSKSHMVGELASNLAEL